MPKIGQILLKIQNVAAMTAALTVSPVIGGPHTDAFGKHAFKDIAVSAGMLTQPMGDNHARPFGFSLELSIKKPGTIAGRQFAG